MIVFFFQSDDRYQDLPMIFEKLQTTFFLFSLNGYALNNLLDVDVFYNSPYGLFVIGFSFLQYSSVCVYCPSIQVLLLYGK